MTLQLFCSIITLALLLPSTLFAAQGILSGAGTELSPYLIEDFADLNVVKNDLQAWYRLERSIDATPTPQGSSSGFLPIGSSNAPFVGNFNGGGHQIHGITINRGGNSSVGLFGFVGDDGIIDNLNITGKVYGYQYVGCVVGYNKGIVRNVAAQCDVYGRQGYTGGVVGYNTGTIEMVSVSGIVSGGSSYIGGVCGYSTGAISKTVFSGKVLSTRSYRGGIVGYLNNGSIDESLSYGYVTRTSYSGGLVGRSISGVITNSYWNTALSNQSVSAGSNGTDYRALSIDEMKNQSSFTQWDFANTWVMGSRRGVPVLQNVTDAPIGISDRTSLFVDTLAMGAYLLNDTTNMGGVPTVYTFLRIEGRGDSLDHWYIPGEDRTTDTLWGMPTLVRSPNIEIEISNYTDLKKIGVEPDYPLYAGYRLNNDINAAASVSDDNGAGFKPIGGSGVGERFTGYFNGAGHVIYNFSIKRNSESRVGLFQAIDTVAFVDSLGIEGTVVGHSYVGMISALLYGTINESYAVGTVEADQYTGMLVGHGNRGTINESYGIGYVKSRSNAGGLIGYSNYGAIRHSFASTIIESSSSYSFGGLVGGGHSHGIESSYWDKEKLVRTGVSQQNGRGILASDLVQQSTFVNWDFTETWSLDNGAPYPQLKSVKNTPIAFNDTAVVVDTLNLEAFLLNDLSIEGNELASARLISVDSGGAMVRYSYQAGELLGADTLYGAPAVIYSPQPVISITTYDDLKKIGNEPGYPLNGSYRLVADIDASASQTENESQGFEPIGSYSNHFNGKFNGAGYTISQLYSNRPDDYIGMFATIGVDGIVDSLTLLGSVTGEYSVGLLAGQSYGSIHNTHIAGTVVGENYVGGLTGSAWYGQITHVSSNIMVTGTDEYTGGIIGYNTGEITHSYSVGSVSGEYSVGGLIGYSEGVISESYSLASVIGDENVGGLIGDSRDSIRNCYSHGYVFGLSETGGLIGSFRNGSIENSYRTGLVEGGRDDVGGFIGYQSSGAMQNTMWHRSSGVLSSIGYRNSGDTPLELTESEMKIGAHFVGWDFAQIWENNQNGTFPQLRSIIDAPIAVEDALTTSIDTTTMLPFVINDIAPEGGEVNAAQYLYKDSVGGIERYFYQAGSVASAGDTLWGGISFVPKQLPVIEISSYEDLKKIGVDANYPLNASYRVTADIDASESAAENSTLGFIPIGRIGEMYRAFTGKFNGAGFSIEDLTINRPNVNRVGLFTMIGTQGIVENLSLSVTIHGDDNVGAVAGNVYGTLNNIRSKGSITGTNKVGGIAGTMLGRDTVLNVHFSGSLFGESNVGGLFGSNNGTLVSSSVVGTIQGGNDVGGIVGFNEGIIEKSFASVHITGEENVAGFVASNYGTIRNSYSVGLVEGDDDVFAFNERNYGIVEYCYTNTVVQTDGDKGAFDLTDRGEYNTSSSSSLTSSDKAPPPVPNAEESNKSYGTQSIFWNRDRIGILAQDGYGVTDAQMRHESLYESWDFNTVWEIREGASFPGLQVLNDAPLAGIDTVSAIADPSDLSDYLSLASDVENTEATVWRTLKDTRSGGYDTYWYAAGEPIASGDTLWGGYGYVTTPSPLISIPDYATLSSIGHSAQYPLNGNYRLTQNIDASASITDNTGDGFEPIASDSIHGFTGRLNGAGFTISDLTINRESQNGVGLFSWIGEEGVIDSLTITGTIIGGNSVGGIAGRVSGTVYESAVHGTISGKDSVGGLFGYQMGTTEGSYFSGEVTGTNYVGGFAGYLQGSVAHSYTMGSVSATGTYVGGFAGGLYGEVTRSFASTITETTISGWYAYIGGFAGSSEGIITQSYSTGSVYGTKYYRGGFVGNLKYNGIIKDSYSQSALASGTYSGTFAGYSNGTIEQCYSSFNGTNNSFVGSQNGSVVHSYSVRAGAGSNTNNRYGYAYVDRDVLLHRETFNKWDFSTVWEMVDGYTLPGLIGVHDPSYGRTDTTSVIDTSDISFALLNDKRPDAGTPTLWRVVNDTSLGGNMVVVYQPGDALVSGDTLWGAASKIYAPYTVIELPDYATLKRVGVDPLYPLDGNYRVTADIDASLSQYENEGAGFQPIGGTQGFSGKFDGGGFTISGIVIHRPSEDTIGLFRKLNGHAHIMNVSLDATIEGDDYVGAFVGVADSMVTLSNIKVEAMVDGDDYVGGVIGKSTATTAMDSVYNKGTVTGTRYVGGVGGSIGGTITNSHSLSDVEGQEGYIGGLVGRLTGAVDRSYAVGSVHGEYNVGGLVGYLQGVIDRSFTSGIVKGESAVGGIAGEVQGDHSCSNSNSPGEITNTYTYSTVKGSEGAGISGYNGGLISASYAGGYVEDLFGGGITSYTTGTITHSFWNTSVTNQQWSDGMNGKDYALLSDSAQFKRQSYYYWDFDSTWMMNEGETHPVLQDMETPPFAAPDTFAVGSSFNLVRLMDNDFDGGSPDASLTLSIETIDGQGTTDSLTWYSFSQSVPKGTQDTVFYRLMKQLNSGDTLWSRGVAFLTNSVNTAPIATVDTIVVAEDGAYTIDPQLFIANDYDTENDFISLVSYVSTGLTGGVVADGTSIVYTPLNNWNGSSIITYVVSDGDLTATGNVVVVVTPSNDGPTLTETYPQNMLEEAALTVSLAMTDGADIDGDALQVIVGVGEYYTVAGAVVTPVKDYVGSLAVPVRVTDGVDTTAVVTLVVTVTDVPESTNTGTAGTIPDTSNPVIPVGGGDMDVTSSSLAQESSSVLYEGSIDDGGLSSAASVGYSSSSLDSTGVSPVLFNGYQGTGYSRMVRMSDVSYTIQHAPEFANSYTLYSIHGKKITEGSVHMGESSLPPFLTHGLVIVKFH